MILNGWMERTFLAGSRTPRQALEIMGPIGGHKSAATVCGARDRSRHPDPKGPSIDTFLMLSPLELMPP
jgi:hypothetical protein